MLAQKRMINEEQNSELINNSDKLGRNALHLAVKHNKLEIVKFLIEEKKINITKKDIKGRTPLWVAASKNHVECLKILLENQADVNQKNLRNISVLQVAAMKNHTDCLKLLLEKKVDLSSTNYKEENVVTTIINNVDEYETYLLEAFDSRIKKEQGKKKEFTCDFGILSPQDLVQTQIVCSIFDLCQRKEQNEILTHPIFALFLDRKEKRPIYKFLLLIEFIVLMFYWFGVLFFFIGLRQVDKRKEIMFERFFFITVIVGRILLGILKLNTMPYMSQHKTSILINYINPCMLFVIASTDLIVTDLNSFEMFYNYIIYFVSITFLLVCIEPLLFFGRLFKLDHYVDLFFIISKRVLTIFCLFFWILFGFAISFHLLFGYYKEFNNIISSTFKTIVMMTGEFDYEEIFKTETTDNKIIERLESPIPKLIFLLFINLICIVFVNLIIGLTIDDIRTLQKQNKIRNLQKRFERFAQIENFFKWCADNSYFDFFKKFPTKILEFSYVEKECTFSENEIKRISPELLDKVKLRTKLKQEGKDSNLEKLTEKIINLIKEEKINK